MLCTHYHLFFDHSIEVLSTFHPIAKCLRYMFFSLSERPSFSSLHDSWFLKGVRYCWGKTRDAGPLPARNTTTISKVAKLSQ